jgi:purine-nucleoside phosphorylase
VDEAANYVLSVSLNRPTVGIVLGSGLGAFAESLADAIRIPYRDIPGLPVSTAIGHKGELVIGMLKALHGQHVCVAAMSGRFHLYEGYTPQQTVAGIHLFHSLGIRRVILTNAAGGINPLYAEGALVLISDHINLQGVNPLTGPNDDKLGPRFPDMSEVYSLRLRKIARSVAAHHSIPLVEGVYLAVTGPSYETPAEIRFMAKIGADLVGMSTVAEAIAANHMGMEVLGISCVTNVAAGLSSNKLSQEEVLVVGNRISGMFTKLVHSILAQIA